MWEASTSLETLDSIDRVISPHRFANIRIAYMQGNPEVGNSEVGNPGC